MVSRLQDVGVTTYGHTDEPSVSAISQPDFQEQPSENVVCFAKIQLRQQLTWAEMIRWFIDQLIDGKLIDNSFENQIILKSFFKSKKAKDDSNFAGVRICCFSLNHIKNVFWAKQDVTLHCTIVTDNFLQFYDIL